MQKPSPRSEHVEEEVVSAAPGETIEASVVEEDVILLPGETRAPRIAVRCSSRRVPRSSARIGGNPRSRFQRPFRSGGRDRGRDNVAGARIAVVTPRSRRTPRRPAIRTPSQRPKA